MSHAITKRLQICADINIECMVRGDPAHKSRGGERAGKIFEEKRSRWGRLLATQEYTHIHTHIYII